jgi:hypothetical protein
MWKNRDIPVLKAFGFVIEELEEAQLQLQSLLSIRHVAPFKDDVQKFLTSLSDTADTLEMWVKVARYSFHFFFPIMIHHSPSLSPPLYLSLPLSLYLSHSSSLLFPTTALSGSNVMDFLRKRVSRW